MTVINGDALKTLPALEGEFDFVFIDANKPDYLKYLKAIEPKLKKGAVVVADNVIVLRPGDGRLSPIRPDQSRLRERHHPDNRRKARRHGNQLQAAVAGSAPRPVRFEIKEKLLMIRHGFRSFRGFPALVIAAAVVALLAPAPAGAQWINFGKDDMVAYTADNPFDRFPDGRPKVPDDLVERARGLSAEEVWGVLPGKGFRNQYEDGFQVLHPGKKLVGRAFYRTVHAHPAPTWTK